MKKLSLLALCVLVLALANCHKHNCTMVTITNSGIPCSTWGIRVNNHTYPADSIPVYFRQEGIVVCANYELYEDMRLCACCGGTWAKILSMKNLDE